MTDHRSRKSETRIQAGFGCERLATWARLGARVDRIFLRPRRAPPGEWPSRPREFPMPKRSGYSITAGDKDPLQFLLLQVRLLKPGDALLDGRVRREERHETAGRSENLERLKGRRMRCLGLVDPWVVQRGERL